MFEEDDDGDYGVVECGRCGVKMYRHEAFMSDRYVYACNDCLDEEEE